MIYINFDGTKRGVSYLGNTPAEQLATADSWLAIARDKDIELHLGSQHEAVLLRILRRVREKAINPDDINFSVNGMVIEITPDGDFAEPIPGGFFEWRAAELF